MTREERQSEIHSKGFNIVEGRPSDETPYGNYAELAKNVTTYNKLKVNTKVIQDAVFGLGTLKKANPRLADKTTVLRAINDYDLVTMREISDFFYKTSGIYARILRYMAFMYRYDWYVTPFLNDKSYKEEKFLDGFNKSLKILDNFNVKKKLGEIALKVLRFGCYYAYKVPSGTENIYLQELPQNYCRTRFFQGDKPVVEFNMKYFDDSFRSPEVRMKMLNMFPDEFKKGYRLYQERKLPPMFQGDTAGWYPLDPNMTVKFTANGEDYPAFISVIPLIIDLDEAQDLDKKKMQQRLLKIVVQKLPLDKNDELLFDNEEAKDIHNNAVAMLSRAIGVDVLTTFADVSVEDVADSSATTAQSDDLERVERQVYNEAGVSQMQFNTDGNIALEKSILNDEATLYNMILQFETFLNDLIVSCNKNTKKAEYRVQILTTTIYNYKELAKMYKEQVQLGYSKMLPQIALGQSQSSILANAYFENDVLDLVELFIPPLMSSTMNGDVLGKTGKNKDAGSGQSGDGDGAGRKELPDDQKTEKTIKNKESAN